MRRALPAAVGAAALVLAISGCGGSSGGAKHEDARTAFKKQANAVCKDTFAKLQTISKDMKDPAHPTQAELTKAVDQIIGHLNAEHTDLAALTAPAELAAGVRTLLASLQDVIDAAGKKGAKFIKVGSTPFNQVDADANAIGLTDCAY